MKVKLALVVILVLGIFLRFYKLGAVPAHLNRDEAAIGYNAYSILKTCRDEHGVFLPINVESFGDWKLPVYIYSALPALAIFGLTAWSVKLPAAIAGSALILLAFLLTRILLRNYATAEGSRLTRSQKYLPLFTAFVIAVSPWAIHLSKLTYEANLALCLFALGWYLVEKYKNIWKIIFGVFFLALTLLTYHSYQAIIPIFGLTWLIFNFSWLKKMWREDKLVLALPVIVVLSFAIILLLGHTGRASTTKFAGLSIFETVHYQQESVLARAVLTNAGIPKVLQVTFFSPAFTFTRAFLSNLLTTFSPDFLFIYGGSHATHNVSGVANFYLFEFILLLAGVVALWRAPVFTRFHKFLIAWLLIAALPAIITVEPAHSVRAAALLLPLAILIASGSLYLIHLKNWFKFPLALLYFAGVVYFFLTYFFLAPARDFDRHEWYFRQIAVALPEHKNNYHQIYMPMLRRSPYIYLLFYWQYDPNLLAENLHFLPPDEEGFVYADQLENISFLDPDWGANEASGQKILYLLEETQIPIDKFSNPHYQILDVWQSASSIRSLYWLEFNPGVDTAQLHSDSTNTEPD